MPKGEPKFGEAVAKFTDAIQKAQSNTDTLELAEKIIKAMVKGEISPEAAQKLLDSLPHY